MFRKLLIILTIVAAGVFCLSGCKKGPGEAESEREVKTMADYEIEANTLIDIGNMDEELESLEEQIELDLSQEQ